MFSFRYRNIIDSSTKTTFLNYISTTFPSISPDAVSYFCNDLEISRNKVKEELLGSQVEKSYIIEYIEKILYVETIVPIVYRESYFVSYIWSNPYSESEYKSSSIYYEKLCCFYTLFVCTANNILKETYDVKDLCIVENHIQHLLECISLCEYMKEITAYLNPVELPPDLIENGIQCYMDILYYYCYTTYCDYQMEHLNLREISGIYLKIGMLCSSIYTYMSSCSFFYSSDTIIYFQYLSLTYKIQSCLNDAQYQLRIDIKNGIQEPSQESLLKNTKHINVNINLQSKLNGSYVEAASVANICLKSAIISFNELSELYKSNQLNTEMLSLYDKFATEYGNIVRIIQSILEKITIYPIIHYQPFCIPDIFKHEKYDYTNFMEVWKPDLLNYRRITEIGNSISTYEAYINSLLSTAFNFIKRYEKQINDYKQDQQLPMIIDIENPTPGTLSLYYKQIHNIYFNEGITKLLEYKQKIIETKKNINSLYTYMAKVITDEERYYNSNKKKYLNLWLQSSSRDTNTFVVMELVNISQKYHNLCSDQDKYYSYLSILEDKKDVLQYPQETFDQISRFMCSSPSSFYTEAKSEYTKLELFIQDRESFLTEIKSFKVVNMIRRDSIIHEISLSKQSDICNKSKVSLQTEVHTLKQHAQKQMNILSTLYQSVLLLQQNSQIRDPQTKSVLLSIMYYIHYYPICFEYFYKRQYQYLCLYSNVKHLFDEVNKYLENRYKEAETLLFQYQMPLSLYQSDTTIKQSEGISLCSNDNSSNNKSITYTKENQTLLPNLLQTSISMSKDSINKDTGYYSLHDSISSTSSQNNSSILLTSSTNSNLLSTNSKLPTTNSNLLSTNSNLLSTNSKLPTTNPNLLSTNSNLPLMSPNLPATKSPKSDQNRESYKIASSSYYLNSSPKMSSPPMNVIQNQKSTQSSIPSSTITLCFPLSNYSLSSIQSIDTETSSKQSTVYNIPNSLNSISMSSSVPTSPGMMNVNTSNLNLSSGSIPSLPSTPHADSLSLSNPLSMASQYLTNSSSNIQPISFTEGSQTISKNSTIESSQRNSYPNSSSSSVIYDTTTYLSNTKSHVNIVTNLKTTLPYISHVTNIPQLSTSNNEDLVSPSPPPLNPQRIKSEVHITTKTIKMNLNQENKTVQQSLFIDTPQALANSLQTLSIDQVPNMTKESKKPDSYIYNNSNKMILCKNCRMTIPIHIKCCPICGELQEDQ